MLNKSKDYGFVQGHPHAMFYQKGKYFNNAGYEVDLETGEVLEDVVVDDKTVDETPDDNSTVPNFTENDDESDDVVADLDSLAWQTVKKRVEAAGGEWTNKEQGIAYLKGL